jgi:alpha-glucosidase (family GH31 glycosyl hydrolase)
MISRRTLLKYAGASGVRLLAGAAPTDSAIVMAGREVELVITPITPVTTRLSIAEIAVGEPRVIENDGSLVERAWPAPAARIRSLARTRRVASGDLVVRVSRVTNADPSVAAGRGRPALSLAIGARDGREVQRLSIDAATGALTFRLGDGPLLGLGEGGPQFDRRGSVDAMRSGQGGYQLRTHGGRVPIQWLVGTSGWALFIHHPSGAFDFSTSEGRFDPAAPLPLDLFVVAAREPAAVMAEYAKLTGYPEMPPLWAFGYQQSHRTLASREEILQEAKTFREKRLPCETLIYLGTGFCPSGWNTDNGEFAFNPRVFPDPEAIIRQLHDDHFKVVLHVVLEGRKLTGTVADRCTAATPLPSGKTADGRWPDERQVACYWPFHKALADAGVDGWWPDQGDGLDAPSRLARNRMYSDGSRLWRPHERPFALHRNGHAGMQRYGAFLWSGDVYSTWETLRTHVAVGINAALSGIPFWGTDIGGFIPTKELTGELYARWFQFGAFCPLFRAHGRTWKLRLPWGWNTGALGPDEITTSAGGAANPDASELHNAAVEPACRRYLELRSRLTPYLYTAVRSAHVTGMPIVRALWLHYPDDPLAVARGDEYLWGPDILVAPVVERGAASRRLYLPRGRWYDFWTDEARGGGRDVVRAIDLETLPLFVRAGAILPLAPVRQYSTEALPPDEDVLTLQLYPGADGALTLYEDDGRSYAFARGDWMELEVRWLDAARRLMMRLAARSRMRPPARRNIHVRLVGTGRAADIAFDGSPIELRL